jgi:hypothetical protein
MCAAREQEERGEEEAYGPLAERYHVVIVLELESDGKPRGKQSHNKQPETRSKVVRCPPSLLWWNYEYHNHTRLVVWIGRQRRLFDDSRAVPLFLFSVACYR